MLQSRVEPFDIIVTCNTLELRNIDLCTFDFDVSIFHLRQLMSKQIPEKFLQKFILPRNIVIFISIIIILLEVYICTTQQLLYT